MAWEKVNVDVGELGSGELGLGSSWCVTKEGG